MKERKLRYGVYLGKIQRNRRRITYSQALEAERLLQNPPRLRIIDLHRLLTPYVSVRFVDQVRAVVMEATGDVSVLHGPAEDFDETMLRGVRSEAGR